MSPKFVHFGFFIMYKDTCFVYFNISIRSQEFVFDHDFKLHLLPLGGTIVTGIIKKSLFL